jgi:hypothetical protein
MRTILAVSTALAGTLLAICVVSGPAQATSLPVLKSDAPPGIVTLVGRRGGGGGGAMRGGGGGGRSAIRGGGGGYKGGYRGGRYSGNIGRYHGGNRYYGNRYGNRYGYGRYGYRRYGYWPWIGVGAYGSTNCDWLYRHNYRRWLAVCQ